MTDAQISELLRRWMRHNDKAVPDEIAAMDDKDRKAVVTYLKAVRKRSSSATRLLTAIGVVVEE